MLLIQPNRRVFLRSAGVCMALPGLEAFQSKQASGQSVAPDGKPPKRMVCVGNEFGMYPGAFWPKGSGREYAMSPLLEPLEALRDQFTLFSHLDHGQKGGHFAVHTFLTGVKSNDAKGRADGCISLDQRAAEYVGSKTRFPTLTIGSEGGLHGGPMMSWTRTGTRVPPITGPRELFRALFQDDAPSEKAKATERIELQGSILDVVLDDAKSLRKQVSKVDNEKLQEYFSAIREVESKLQLDRQWQSIGKPAPNQPEPTNEGLTRDLPKLYDLILLALQTDSTRIATLEIGGSFIASDLGVKKGYHGLSHHGKVQASIDLLVQLEKYQVQQFSRFLGKLAEQHEPNTDGTLLDNTLVLFGSGMGNANSHTNVDLPIVLAGGGFRHGEHKVYPKDSRRRVPLCNLFVSMLQQFGLETEQFGNSSGTLSGLETV